jgi:hypothetical protein
MVYTVALYGSNAPYIIKGHLVLRTYYKDSACTQVDIAHTNDHVMDTVFYESNKTIREQMEDGYNGRRQLVELSMPALGREYRIIYNAAEIPSHRYDDSIALLSLRDPDAHGVAIIMKRNADNLLCWLDENEARVIARKLTMTTREESFN